MERGVIRKITLITNFRLNIYYCWQPVARSPHARNPHARSPHARKIAIPCKHNASTFARINPKQVLLIVSYLFIFLLETQSHLPVCMINRFISKPPLNLAIDLIK